MKPLDDLVSLYIAHRATSILFLGSMILRGHFFLNTVFCLHALLMEFEQYFCQFSIPLKETLNK